MMNGFQCGDIFHGLSACKEYSQGFVKLILISDKEYVVVACDENGVEYRSEKLQYIQRHVFIEKYEKVIKRETT